MLSQDMVYHKKHSCYLYGRARGFAVPSVEGGSNGLQLLRIRDFFVAEKFETFLPQGHHLGSKPLSR